MVIGLTHWMLRCQHRRRVDTLRGMERRIRSRDAFVAPLSRDRRDAVLLARRRPMARRLELALAWNELAADLRSGLRRAQARKR